MVAQFVVKVNITDLRDNMVELVGWTRGACEKLLACDCHFRWSVRVWGGFFNVRQISQRFVDWHPQRQK